MTAPRKKMTPKPSGDADRSSRTEQGNSGKKTEQAISCASREVKVSSPVVTASAPYFLPYQEDWIADEAPFKLYEKSRRIGATYSTSYRAFRKCLLRQNFTQWVSSRDLLTAKEFITDYVARWCKLANIAASGLTGEDLRVFDEAKNIKAFVVEFPMTNSRIVSLSSTPEVFAGKGGDVLLDEVDLHDDPGALIDMAMPCTTWGGQLEAVSAYKVDGSPASVFARLCADAKGANPMHASFHRTTILDAVAQGFVECVNRATSQNWTRDDFLTNLRARCRTESAWQSQYLCNPQDDGGALLTYGLIGGCETDAAALQAHRDPAAPAFLGIDVGRKHDLTVFWLLRRIGDVMWTDRIQCYSQTMFRDQLDAASALIRDARVTRCCIDSTGIGAMLAEELQRTFGQYTVEAVQFTNPVKLDLGMPMLQAFQDRAVRIPNDHVIREDLHKVRKTATAAGNVRLEAESDEAGHADRFWALALALHAGHNAAPVRAPMLFETRRTQLIRDRGSREIVWA